jgi:hypothetical protein
MTEEFISDEEMRIMSKEAEISGDRLHCSIFFCGHMRVACLKRGAQVYYYQDLEDKWQLLTGFRIEDYNDEWR